MSAVAVLRAAVGARSFDAAIVLGTGLGPVADAVRDPVIVPYADLDGFPGTGVSGHAGRLVVGELGGRRVAVMQGRAHYYEHGNPRAMAGAIETFARFGTGALLLTNACGSLRPDMPPGSLMAIADHLSLFAPNPLIGLAGDDRFVPMNDAYDPALRAVMKAAAAKAGVPLHHGVYAWVSGPSFETPAEIRALSRLGADAVGMSTVPEVILARHAGLRVAALAGVTNFAAGLVAEPPSHRETKEVAATIAGDASRVIEAFLQGLLT